MHRDARDHTSVCGVPDVHDPTFEFSELLSTISNISFRVNFRWEETCSPEGLAAAAWPRVPCTEAPERRPGFGIGRGRRPLECKQLSYVNTAVQICPRFLDWNLAVLRRNPGLRDVLATHMSDTLERASRPRVFWTSLSEWWPFLRFSNTSTVPGESERARHFEMFHFQIIWNRPLFWGDIALSLVWAHN